MLHKFTKTPYITTSPKASKSKYCYKSFNKAVRMSSSRGSSSNVFNEEEEEKLQVNSKVITFRNKSCIDCGEQATIKVSESVINPKRLYYKCERPGCDYFRWWEPSNFEYKVIGRELGKLQDEKDNQNFQHENKFTTMTTNLIAKSDKIKSLLYTIIIMLLQFIMYIYHLG